MSRDHPKTNETIHTNGYMSPKGNIQSQGTCSDTSRTHFSSKSIVTKAYSASMDHSLTA